jgi:dipeptidyl aminopeptidase/acylaminoacyl peptidase
MRLAYLLAVLTLFMSGAATAAMSPTMIVEMREITSVSVSPNGQLAVVGIRQSNPNTNRRDPSWVIVPLHGDGAPKTIPGGEEIYYPAAASTQSVTPQALWSSDGHSFFYLRRDGEQVQLWETRADGSMSRQVTHSTSDLMDLKRSSDPDQFIVQLAPDREALRKAEEDEYRNGLLYDDHVVGVLLLTRTQPVIDRWRNARRTDSGDFVPPGWTGLTSAVFDVRLDKLVTAGGAVPKGFTGSESGANRVRVVALSPMPKDPYNYGGKYTLQLEPQAGGDPILRCEVAACIANRINVIGWSPDGTQIYYLADSLQGPLGGGYPGGAAIYSWNPRGNVVRMIHDAGTEGLWGRLYNSEPPSGITFVPAPIIGREFVLAFSGSDQPPRLEAISLDTGVTRVLFDPNAELRSLTQGRATWRTWDTSSGYTGRGIMVLPEDYHPGEKYPAVITTYNCGNGFLRGGSGDNAPEYVLAHQGFIAICADVRIREIIAHETDPARLYPVFCEMMLGLIADLAKEGIVDSARVGISGQSFGSDGAAYCISHSKAFAAAAIRHGSAIERERYELFDTSAWIRGPNGVYAQLNLPDPRNDPTGRWDAVSSARRARDINTPTLIQTDEHEWTGALPLWSAMHQEEKPIEMFVFLGDSHLLRQPIHMLLNFERQLDWFRFWLKHEEDPAPSKRAQYDRWTRLRDLLPHSRSQQ